MGWGNGYLVLIHICIGGSARPLPDRIPWDKVIKGNEEAVMRWYKDQENKNAHKMFELKIPASEYPQVIRADLCTLIECKRATSHLGFRVKGLDYRGYGLLPEGTPPPSVISIHQNYKTPDLDCTKGKCNHVYITIKSTRWYEGNMGSHLDNTVFGVKLEDDRTECCFQIQVDKGGTPSNMTRGSIYDQGRRMEIVEVKNLEQAFEIETGYEETNAWVEWVRYSARIVKKDNCYACASARPQAQIVPFPLGWRRDQSGMECMLALYQDKTAWGNRTCTSLSLIFPPVKKNGLTAPPSFLTTTVNHSSCLSRHDVGSGKNVGELEHCLETKHVTGEGNYSLLNVPRADVWWYCGGRILRPTLPPQWKGTCALVQLAVPFTLAFEKHDIKKLEGKRHKRGAVPTSFDDQIYIDSIGVPRGVPDEFKARNQIAAGFESLFWWVTVNKNVDWINYIYYNQQRFINYTRDAVRGIAEQLDATSRMSWENRLALDMMLAEKGGVCVMLGGRCCTFIPNNTAPDGSITRALQGLRTLAEELAENAGVDTSLTGWLDSWFGKWKGMIISIFTSLITVFGILVAIGCCIIPCVRGLTQRLIETALTRQMPLKSDQGENMYLLDSNEKDEVNKTAQENEESRIMFEKFEATYFNHRCAESNKY